MSLSDVGNMAEAVAAVAVVVSLVYLAIQIQQNTKAVRASSYQEVANGVTDFQSSLAQNEGFSIFRQKKYLTILLLKLDK